ncbi:hypothetical protein IT398_02265 [Candidatus Nomurabacteria bacterium]|nr:hypothetical protein [Candidatus Nomurabacteria bacterium]
MDILSHGLYGGIAFGRSRRRQFWQSFFFGVMPDLFSFGIFTAATVLGLVSGPDWSAGTPDPSAIPAYVHTLYNITHSLVIAGVVIVAVRLLRRKFFFPLFAWPLHILVDIPTHSDAFFPTPFLWPLSDFYINGVSWGTPYILLPNIALLAVLYAWFYYSRRRKQLSTI